MKIALLSYEYPPDTGYGGIGTYSFYQARALVKLGHEVHVFAGSHQPGFQHSEHDGVQVTRAKVPSRWLDKALGGLKSIRAGWAVNRAETAFSAYHAFAKAARRQSFDVVEMPECGADGLLVTSYLDVPSVVKLHSPARLIMGIYDVPRIDHELTALFERAAIGQCTALTSCSRFLADAVRNEMHVRRPIDVVPNGIDLELFDRDNDIDVYERFGLPRDPDSLVVFFANRLEERKGIHLVRDMCHAVMQKHPQVHFAFAGDDKFGYMQSEIRPFIDRGGLGDRLHYFGKLDLPEVRALLKHIDVFLLPSLWENAPYSCLEAMSAGRAIVSSDCGGLPELIEDGATGVLARNDDGPSFVQALERVIADADGRDRMGAAARRAVEERYTDTRIAAASLAVYERAARG